MSDDLMLVDKLLLSADQETELDELILRGYTLRRIWSVLTLRGWTTLPTLPAYLEYVNRKTKAEQLESARSVLDAIRRRYGMSSSSVRQDRLTLLAERLEKAIGLDEDDATLFNGNTRLIEQYRRVLGDLREESAPKAGVLSGDDEWVQLIRSAVQHSIPQPTSPPLQISSPSTSTPSSSSETSSTAPGDSISLPVESVELKATPPPST